MIAHLAIPTTKVTLCGVDIGSRLATPLIFVPHHVGMRGDRLALCDRCTQALEPG